MAHLKRMQTLKSLDYLAMRKIRLRRQKLILSLQEQLLHAEASIDGRVHITYRKLWITNSEGVRVQVDHPKRFRPWFWTDKSGAYISVWYSGKQLTLHNNAKFIRVINKRRIPGAIRQLIRAVENGELDLALEDVAERGMPVLRLKTNSTPFGKRD